MKLTTGRSKQKSHLIALLIIQFAVPILCSNLQVKPNPPIEQQQATLVSKNKLDQVREKLFNLNEADENGIFLLGLFDVHLKRSTSSPNNEVSSQQQRQSRSSKPFSCGPIDADSGEFSSRRPMQNMWAFLWAIEQVNQDDALLPGVRLGSLVLDTCSNELQTSQQLANLLHGHHEDKLPRASQFAALLADQRHWRSVEATASVASAQGLTTFVTQTRSTRLNEQANHDGGPSSSRPAASSTGDSNLDSTLRTMTTTSRQADERLLSGLLGIGSMMTLTPGINNEPQTQAPSNNEPELRLIKMVPGNEMLADALASLCDHMKWDLISVIYDASEPDLVDLHEELMRELFLRNTQLALVESLDESGADMADKNLERLLMALARKTKVGSRVVITLLSIQNARRLQAKLSELRRRAAILAAAGNAEPDQGQTKRIAAMDSGTLKQLNSIQWITITDREPYYSFPTDSLGVISVSSSSSLMPEFKHYYDHLKLVEQARNHSIVLGGGNDNNEQNSWLRQPINKWWPDYVRAIMTRRREQLGDLLVDECAKWREPKASPLNQRCQSLNLAALANLERQRATPASARTASKPAAANGTLESGRQQNQAATSRYLASGWDHNGMDVINSVLAIANGLESIRQNLCPNVTSGLCPEMRQLISAPSNNDSTQQQQASLSELVHEELTKLTFPLVDGQVFRLNSWPSSTASSNQLAAVAAFERAQAQKQDDDLTSGLQASGFLPAAAPEHGRAQLEAKLKFYNLRFLRANSIGFVKFAHFSQEDGLTWQTLTQSEALHYSSIPGNFSDQIPMREVKSSCSDATKCLMLSTFMNSISNNNGDRQQAQPLLEPQPLYEEQLAAGFNTLFKLDHPLISAASNQNSSRNAITTAVHGQEANAHRDGLLWVELWHKIQGRVRWMVSRAKFQSVPLSDPFGQESDGREESDNQSRTTSTNQATNSNGRRRREFDVLVLLPVHKSRKVDASSKQFGACDECCGSPKPGVEYRVDEEHSFQQMAALAYAQQLVNGHLQPTWTAKASETTNSSAGNSQRQNELAILVIDYCGQVESVEKLLADYLSFYQEQAKWLKLIGPVDHPPGQLVAVVDFDSQVAKLVDRTLAKSGLAQSLLHLTIARHGLDKRQQQISKLPAHYDDDHDQDEDRNQADRQRARHIERLRINPLPGKNKEIETLLSLIKSFPAWRLVHLIYTDSHDYRDEFVRRANEANICVSKLIWIPTQTNYNEADSSGARSGQVDRIRQLFKRELYDFSSPTNQKVGGDKDEGLNQTRVLVVLASSSDATNRLLLEAATESMLNDYVWLTSHEWLRSIELPLELESASEADRLRRRAPRYFLSTKLEAFEEHQFREYFSHLLPALHEPIPRDWFDEFWQQRFSCHLPSITTTTTRDSMKAQNYCNYSQRLEWNQMRDVDDLVPYTIRAIESLHVALSGIEPDEANASWANGQQDELKRSRDLARDFKLAFDLGTREVVGNVAANQRGASEAPVRSLVGFHIVHRLLPQRPAQASAESRRRTNGKKLWANNQVATQLVRVGLWRDHYQLKHGHKLAMTPFGGGRLAGAEQPGDLLNDRGSVLSVLENMNVNSDGALQPMGRDSNQTDSSVSKWAEQTANELMLEAKSKSLERLAGIKSRCQTNGTCELCKHQIGLTMSLIKQEETRRQLRDGSNELRAFSGSAFVASSLDNTNAMSNFESDDELSGSNEDDAVDNRDQENNLKPEPAELMSAAASSLFDKQVSEQVASDTKRAYRRHYAPSPMGQTTSSWLPNIQLRRHLLGALLSVFSLIGVAFTVATMTYFYPNTQDQCAGDNQRQRAARPNGAAPPNWTTRRVKKFNQSQRSTSSSQCDIMTNHDDEEDRESDETLNRMRSAAGTNSFLTWIMANVADYLILTGLLMLYSINMAFLMPAASLGVCWLRRVGLPLSYTLLFGAILVKIKEISQRWSDAKSGLDVAQAAVGRNNQLKGIADHDTRQQQLEPVEESVEVTFESLNHNSASEHNSSNELSLDQDTSVGRASAAAKVSWEASAPKGPELEAEYQVGGSLLKIPLLLILVQLAGSLMWLVKQPPEPTLHQSHSCWHCASLARSPMLFLYEPLLSLLLSALLLVSNWLYSTVLLTRISASDTQFSRAMRRLIMNQPLSFTQMQNPDYLRLKQKQFELAEQLHHSKLLVITNTLLVLLWASITLGAVSSSQAMWRLASGGGLGSAATTASTYKQASSLGHNLEDEGQSLVCMNLLSGAIVFIVLFVHRLNWLSGCFLATKARKSHYDQISSSLSFAEISTGGTQQRRRTPFRLFQGRAQRGSKTVTRLQQVSQAGNSSPSNPQGKMVVKNQERVKLQHFNMTYGTYSASGDNLPPADSNREQPSGSSPKPADGEPSNSSKHQNLASDQSQKGSKSKSIFKLRKLSSASKSSTGSAKRAPAMVSQAASTKASNKLQRRQSNGSVASSQANLMRRFSDFDLTDNYDDDDDLDVDELSISNQNQFDMISCAMSVASNSTSQLQGNDLYPIDCSIQLDSQPATGTTPPDRMAATFGEQQHQKHKLAQVEL